MLKFFEQFIRSPRSIGGLLPSSQVLAQEIARICASRITPQYLVVEIGPGLGSITHALKKTLNPESSIHLIEKNPLFYSLLKTAYPDEQIYHSSFVDVDLWAVHEKTPKAIVSSLPWRSLPQDLVEAGQQVLRKELLMNPESFLVQYTYGGKSPIAFDPSEINAEPGRLVLWNFPPAQIWIYSKR